VDFEQAGTGAENTRNDSQLRLASSLGGLLADVLAILEGEFPTFGLAGTGWLISRVRAA